MKCPKCGYTSFDFLESCKKCGQDLQEHKTRYGLRSLLFPELLAGTRGTGPNEDSQPPDPVGAEDLDLGFDFMAEPEETAAETPPQTSPDLPDTASAGERAGEKEDDHGIVDDAEADDFAFSLDDIAEDGWLADGPPDEEVDTEENAEDTTALDFGNDDQEIVFDFDTGDDQPDRPEKTTGGLQAPDSSEEDPAAPFDAAGEADAGLSPARPGNENPYVSPDGESSVAEEPPIFLEPEDVTEPANATEPPQPEPAAEEPLPLLEPEDEPEPATVTEPPQPEPAAEEPLPFLEPEDEPEPVSVMEPPQPEPAAEEPLPLLEPEDATEPAADGGIAVPSLGARLAATACDILVLAVILFLFLAAGEWTLSDAPRRGLLPSTATLVELAIPYFLVFFTLCFGYFTLFHYLTGQTPGKMLFRLRVEGADGAPLTFSQAFLRSVGGLVSLLAAGLGFLVILLRHSRRGWNDEFAGSRLVHCQSENEGAREQDPEPAA